MKIANNKIAALALLLMLTAGCATGTRHADGGMKESRPVSHVASLASWAVKSSGGLLRRVALGTVQMPALDGDIPEISDRTPMDLVAFEKKLDKITGTRQDTGRIKFRVDGDESFGRLTEMLQNAEASLDTGNYSFDHDHHPATPAASQGCIADELNCVA